MRDVFITGTGAFLPNEAVGIDDIEAVIGRLQGQPARVKQFVLANNGIKTRYYAIDPKTGKKTHTNAQLTSEAVKEVLQQSGLSIDDVAGLATGTSSADQLIPSHANMVAGELGLPPAEVISTAGVCASGMSALKYGYMSVATGSAANFVVAGSECASAFMEARQYDPLIESLRSHSSAHVMVSFEKEFLRWMLSDGAGAVLLEPSPRPGALNFHIDLVALRSWAGQLPVCMYAGMNKNEDGTFTHWFDENDRYLFTEKGYLLLQQDVRVLENNMVNIAVEGLKYLIDTTNFDIRSIDWFLPHLSSMLFKDLLLENFERHGIVIPEEKWFTNLSEIGNIGSASIFVILNELAKSGRLQKGQKLLCAVPESARFTMAALILTVC